MADKQGDVDKERGFQIFLNGANRDLGALSKPPSDPPPASNPQQMHGQRVNSRGMLRVAGALPVPCPRRDWRPPPSQPAPRTAGRRRGEASEPIERRVRRQWDLGQAVLVRAEDGEMLQFDVPWQGRAEVLVV